MVKLEVYVLNESFPIWVLVLIFTHMLFWSLQGDLVIDSRLNLYLGPFIFCVIYFLWNEISHFKKRKKEKKKGKGKKEAQKEKKKEKELKK